MGVRRMGPSSFQWCPATGQGATGTNWSRGSSSWTWGRTSFLWGWRSPGPGFPGRLWSLLLWRYSSPAWTRCCAACSGWPCFGRGLGWVTHRCPFQPRPFWDSAPDTWSRVGITLNLGLGENLIAQAQRKLQLSWEVYLTTQFLALYVCNIWCMWLDAMAESCLCPILEVHAS